MEIINNGQITPKRLIALLNVIGRFGDISRNNLQNLMQPQFLEGDQSASNAVINTANRLNLISEVGNKSKTISLHPSILLNSNSGSLESYRLLLQDRLLGILNESQDDYLLNLVIAWYAMKGYSIVGRSKEEVAKDFNSEMSSKDARTLTEEGRAFNSTKLNAWMTWATFLGFGWEYNNQFFQDAHLRIRPMLSQFKEEELQISSFMEALGEKCPELDGGILFTKVKQDLKFTDSGGSNISLMTSTGLRILARNNEIKFIYRADSRSVWSLQKASGHEFQRISHIKVLG